MAKKDDDSSCIGPIIVIVLFFALCKLVQYLESLAIVQKILTGLMIGLFGIFLLAFLIIGIPAIISEARLNKPKKFPVRCHLMEPGVSPIYLVVSVDNHNLGLYAIQRSSNWLCVPVENPENFRRISGGLPSPLALLKGSTNLSYHILPRSGGMTLEMAPLNMVDSTGSLPEYRENERLLIVLAYSAVSRPESKEPARQLEQPVRIRLEVVDGSDRGQPRDTRELYSRILSFLQTQETSDEDDDAWMYRSRPTMPW